MAFDLNQSVRTLGRWYGTKADILAIESAGTGELSRMYVTTDQTETEYYYFVKPNKIDRWRTAGDINTMIAEGQYIKGLSNTEGSITLARTAQGILSASAALSTDPGQILVKKADGSLYATAAPNFANGIEDTISLDLEVVGGKIRGNVKVSGQVNNAYSGLADGAYVQDIRVHTNSQEYMRKNLDGTLEVIARPRIQKVDARTLADIPAFVTAINAGTFVPTKPIEIGDIIFLGEGNYEYMGNGTLPISAADVVVVEGAEGSTTTTRSAIIGGDGWDYNNISGVGSVLPSTQANNDVVAGTDKRIFLDVDQTTSTAGGTTVTVQQHLINLYGLGGAGIQRAGNGLELGAIVAGETPKVVLGGTMEKHTAVAQAGKRLLFTGGAFGVEKQFLQVWDVDTNGYPVASTGSWAHVFVDGRGDIGVVKLTAGTLPN